MCLTRPNSQTLVTVVGGLRDDAHHSRHRSDAGGVDALLGLSAAVFVTSWRTAVRKRGVKIRKLETTYIRREYAVRVCSVLV